MKKFVCTIYILLFSISGLIAQNRFVTSKGKDLVTPSGEKILLKGTNLGNWLVPEGYMFKLDQVNAPRHINELLEEMVGPDETKEFWADFIENYITESDIQYLKSIGSNHLRLPFHYKMFTNETYMGRSYHGFEQLDKVVEWCRNAGLYVLLDMHCAPGGQTGDNIDDSAGYPFLFESEASQQQLVDIWRQIAEHYKDEEVILGYGLLNEPIAHYFEDDLPKLNAKLEPLYKRVVASIREVDEEHLVFLGGAQWNTNFSIFSKPFDDKLVYEFHKYWMPTVKEEIQAYLDFRDKYNVPLYVGETGENTDEWVKDFRMLLEQYEINWCFWPYKKMNNTKGVMNFDEPETYQLISAYAKSDRSSYAKRRENMPDRDKVRVALKGYLEQCKFENCYPNKGYVEGLGLEAKPVKNQ
ncbi:cellulase family glycosylhydrolase [Limibacter armeniacum]|uniref:glycoside hydrolase family 5 protein n=1 Tax=Limibacter armeniacum TaxID=466084 RepID=UPI002FE61E5E